MKIGDVFEIAMCANCGMPIVHTFWGDGGTDWTHENGRWNCYPPKNATPANGTVDKVDEDGHVR